MPLLPVIKENKTTTVGAWNGTKTATNTNREKQEKIVKVCIEHNFVRIHKTKKIDHLLLFLI